MMNMLTKPTAVFIGTGVVVSYLTAMFFWRQAFAAPVLKLSIGSTNQVILSITNGQNSVQYQVNMRRAWDAENPWVYLTNGAIGVTNFTLTMGNFSPGFYQVVEGLDWDLDGVPDFQDAEPTSANVGLLWVTIDSPANGETLSN